MMQMEPQKADIVWLAERFKIEYPFVFYHSALALQNIVDSSTGERRKRAIEAATSGLEILKKFPGVPDRQTIEVLEGLTGSAANT